MPKVCNYPAIYYSIIHAVENLNEKEQVWFMVRIYTCCTWKSRPHPNLWLAKTSGLNRRMRRSSLPWSICGWWCGNLGSYGRFIRITNCKSELHKQLEECHARTRLTMPCRQRAYASMTCNCGKWSFPFLGSHQKTSFKANCRWMPHWEYQILAPVFSAPVCFCSLWHPSSLHHRHDARCLKAACWMHVNHIIVVEEVSKIMAQKEEDCIQRCPQAILETVFWGFCARSVPIKREERTQDLNKPIHPGSHWPDVNARLHTCQVAARSRKANTLDSKLEGSYCNHLWGSVSLSGFNCIYIVVLFAYKIISALCELTELRLTRRSAPWK